MPLWRAAGATEDSGDIGGRSAVIMPREYARYSTLEIITTAGLSFETKGMHACPLSCVHERSCAEL